MFEAHLHCSHSNPLVCNRWLVPLLIGLLTPTLALAQPSLVGNSVEGMPGEVVELAFAWITAGDAAAIQFDLVWDDSVLSEGNLVPGDALVDHVLDWEVIAPGRLRVTVVAANPTALVDANLVYVPFQVAAEAPMGSWLVVVESVVVASASGSAISPIEVVDAEVIVLAAGPAEIPTLGTWGLLLLSALLAVSARRRIGGRVLPLVLLGIGLKLALSTPAGAQPIPGDANGDGKVDAEDIPVIVDQILERAPAPGDPDCNGDATVDVIDTVCVANTAPPGPNAPPVLDPIADLQVREREIVAFVATATDPDLPGDTLTWSLPERPVGASVDPANGSILWVPTANQVGPGSFRVRVSDEAGAFDEEAFAVEVRSLGGPPVLSEITGEQVVEGTLLSVDAEATDPDLPGDALVFDLLLAPVGMAIDPGSGLISWTPTDTQVGTHDVTVRVTDQEGLLDFTPFVVEVLEINVAPSAGDDVFEARLGEPLSVEAQGVLDNDSDPNADALSALLDTAVSEGDLTLNADGSFEYLLEPPDRTIPVELELQCEASVAQGSRFQTLGGTIPVGDVDNDGDLELVGARHIEDNTFLAEVWFLNAADCSEQSFINIEAHGAVSSTSHLGLLDIDGDGDLEIIGTRDRFPFAQGGNFDREHLIAVHPRRLAGLAGRRRQRDLADPGHGGQQRGVSQRRTDLR